jgi:hypothetical protein
VLLAHDDRLSRRAKSPIRFDDEVHRARPFPYGDGCSVSSAVAAGRVADGCSAMRLIAQAIARFG